MSAIQCAVQFCKINIANAPPGVKLHPCPTTTEMRNKWLHALKHKCVVLDWNKSKICSRHFETKCLDLSRKLKPDAVPTIFPTSIKNATPKVYSPKSRIERLLDKKSPSEIMEDLKISIAKLKEPANLDNMVNDDLKFRVEASNEAQLWLIIKKQEHLYNRLEEQVSKNKKHIEFLQNKVQQYKNANSTDGNVETHKYIVKCLQEKLSTLEEQIEILTAVEAR